MTDVYKYLNISGSDVTAGTVVVAANGALYTTTPSAELDPLVGFMFDKYKNQRQEVVYQQLNPTTGSEVPLAAPQAQSISSGTAGTIACDLSSGLVINVSLTTDTTTVTHASPSNIPASGAKVVYNFTRTSGAATVGQTWSALHKGAWTTTGGTASQKMKVVGESDGTNLIFNYSSGWYS